MSMQFKKATKAASKLRLGLTGPSGSGKTYSALAIGTQLGQRVALVDTERGSASLYADRFGFEVLELPDFEAWTYVKAIGAARDAAFDVLIIDSLSHAWEWLKDYVDSIAKAKYRGNTWSAWSEGTPIQNALVEAILQYPGHVLVTMRTKTEWETEKDANGKTKPVKVGLAPIQRSGLEYEFTVMLELSEGGLAKVGKTRWSEIAEKVIEKPGPKFAKEILAWLGAGGSALPVDLVEQKRAVLLARAAELPPARIAKFGELVRAAKDLPALDALEAKLEKTLKAETDKTLQAAAQPEAVSGAERNVSQAAPAAPSTTAAAVPPGGAPTSLPALSPQATAAAVTSTPSPATSWVVSVTASPGEGARGPAGSAPPPAPLSAALGELPDFPSSSPAAAGGGTPSPAAVPDRTAVPGFQGDRVPAGSAPAPAGRAPAVPTATGKVTVEEVLAWIGELQVVHAEAAVKILASPRDHGPSDTPGTIARLIKYGPRCQRFETVYEWWAAAGGTFTTGKDPKTKKATKDFAPMDGPSFSDFWFGQVRHNEPSEPEPLFAETLKDF